MSRNKPKHEWLTIHDMEEEFRFSKPLQATWRMKRMIPYYRFVSTIRYKRTEIEEWFEDKEMK